MSKRLQLSEKAYDRLVAHKRGDETFSEVVLRLTEERSATDSTESLPTDVSERSLLDLAGVWSDEKADAVRSAIAERRERRTTDLTDRER